MRILQLIGAILILFASPALASDGTAWVVTQKSGDVRVVRAGMQPASVQLRAALSPGDLVATGANGRAMLTRGDDYVVVAPGSRLLLPKGEQKKGFTRLIQQVGTMLYKVRHTGTPHFAVETPMLAAVVKGTSFTVIVDDNRAAVQVTEGLVEVSSAAGSARRLVERGMTVYVGRERPDAIIEMKPGTADLPVSRGDGEETVRVTRSGEVPLSAIASLTGGLVREAPAVAPVTNIAIAQPLDLVVSPKPSRDTPDLVAIIGAEPASAIDPVADITDPAIVVITQPIDDVAAPVVDIVDTTLPVIADPVIDVIEATLPVITEPVIDVIAPVIDVVDTALPAITEPVIDVVEPVIDVVEPVIEVVEPVIDVVEPVIEVVEPVIEVVEPVIDVVEPVIDVVETVPVIIAPVVEPVATTAPAIAPVIEPVTTLLPWGSSGSGGSNSGPGGGGSNSGPGGGGSSGPG